MREAGADVTLKVFSVAETAASQAQADNPTLGHEFVFDWLAKSLAAVKAADAR